MKQAVWITHTHTHTNMPQYLQMLTAAYEKMAGKVENQFIQ